MAEILHLCVGSIYLLVTYIGFLMSMSSLLEKRNTYFVSAFMAKRWHWTAIGGWTCELLSQNASPAGCRRADVKSRDGLAQSHLFCDSQTLASPPPGQVLLHVVPKYFSVAMRKHHDQGNVSKEVSIWLMVPVEQKSLTVGRHGCRWHRNRAGSLELMPPMASRNRRDLTPLLYC